MKLTVNIQRGQDVNAFLFDALGAVAFSGEHTLKSAYDALSITYRGRSIYRFVLGKKSISVGSINHGKRIATLSVPT